MRTIPARKTTFAVLAGLTLAGSLAACGAPEQEPIPVEPDGGNGSTGGDTDGGAGGDGAYADGEYTASGSYQAPSGTETVDVTVTLEGDVITAVEVVGQATDPEAKEHQAEFIGGIAAEVVGKDIDDINVSRVAGSSLTSGGFNAAIETIKADAAA